MPIAQWIRYVTASTPMGPITAAEELLLSVKQQRSAPLGIFR